MVAEVVEAEGAEEALPLPAVTVMHWKMAGHLGAMAMLRVAAAVTTTR